jgi:hypothetical protein
MWKYAPASLIALALLAAPVPAAEILPHPPGCPKRLFCGCGVCVKLGIPVATCKKMGLFLAANWKRKFPKAPAGAGMVAARSGHVAYIEAIDANGNAVLYDPNSGNHQTRRWVRSLAGFVVVNPRGGS